MRELGSKKLLTDSWKRVNELKENRKNSDLFLKKNEISNFKEKINALRAI